MPPYLEMIAPNPNEHVSRIGGLMAFTWSGLDRGLGRLT